LDWGAAANLGGSGQSGFGAAYQNAGNPHDVSILPWNARSAGNVNIFASLAPGSTGAKTLTRADNTYWGYGPFTTSMGTINLYQPLDVITAPQHLVTFAGHFDATPTSLDPTTLGTHLLGDSNGPLLLSFDHDISRIGFKIASNDPGSNTNFGATLVAYNGTTVLHTYSINVLGGGGICDSLRVPSNNPNLTPPVPCNDAAFIALDAGPQHFTSIQVFTTSPNGFFISGLQFSIDSFGETPEPGMVLLMSSGLAGLWLFSILRRRFAGTR
jgi:hypothetical protein